MSGHTAEEGLQAVARKRYWFLFGIVACATVAAVLLRFVQDDAYITFRYAANWAAGHGPVFNPGDRVEGYTNFLWMVVMTVPHLLGWDAVTFSYAAGIGCFVVSLVATYHLGVAAFNDSLAGLAATALCAVNYSFVSYATGGLETSLLTALVTVCVLLCVSHFRNPESASVIWRSLLIGVVASASILTRPDAVLLVGPACLAVCYSLLKARRLGSLAWLIVPSASIVLVWLAWKWSFYGSVLPNTYYVKASAVMLPWRGGYYLTVFFIVYFLWIPGVIYLWRIRRAIRRLGPGIAVCMHTSLVLWSVYLLKVGGDFMEFRFLIPLLPVMAVLLGWAMTDVGMRPVTKAGLFAVLVAASVVHGLTFQVSPLCRGMESIPALSNHLDNSKTGWVYIGKALAESFPESSSVRIALTPAGAIPYYSDLYTVDMLGLNDAWVAQNGIHVGSRPGHHRVASIEYLVDMAGVNLIIGHPRNVPPTAADRGYFMMEDLQGSIWRWYDTRDEGMLLDDSQIVVIPVPQAEPIYAIYINPHPHIDRLIESGTWTTYDLR